MSPGIGGKSDKLWLQSKGVSAFLANCSLGGNFGQVGGLDNQFGFKLGLLEGILASTWAKLGPSWAKLGPSRGQVGPSWAPSWCQVGFGLDFYCFCRSHRFSFVFLCFW